MAAGPRPLPLTFGFEPDDFVLPAAVGPEFQAIEQFLRGRGFERVGIKWEHASWNEKRAHELSFASPEAECFASIFLASQTAEPRLYFYTPFQTGEVILTGCYARGDAVETPRARLTGVEARPHREALELHSRSVAEFKQRGLLPFVAWGKAERLAATELYYRNPDTELAALERRERVTSVGKVINGLFVAALITGIFASRLTPLARALGATAICAIVAFRWYVALAFPVKGASWPRRFPFVVTALGALALHWLLTQS